MTDLFRIEDDSSIKEFIIKHGFFLALDPTKEYEMDIKSLFTLVNRLKATISLIMALSETNTNYEKILSLTLYLLLATPVCFDYKNESISFSTCTHELYEVWNNENQLEINVKDIYYLEPRDDWEFVDDILKYIPVEDSYESALSAFLEDDSASLHMPNDNLDDYQNLSILSSGIENLRLSEHKRTFEADINPAFVKYIPDSLHEKNISYYIQKYSYYREQLKENPSSILFKISILYLSCTQVGEYCRLALELIYAVCKEISEIKSWSLNGKLVLADDNSPVPEIFKNKFDKQMQVGLLKLAKHTLKTEMDYNLRETSPSYDAELMIPSWRIDNLLTGLYLTVFYTYPNIQVMRICENISCGLPFDVNASDSKKKYCSESCANAMNQRKHRLNKKVKESNQNIK